jgi:hypothetical protein
MMFKRSVALWFPSLLLASGLAAAEAAGVPDPTQGPGYGTASPHPGPSGYGSLPASGNPPMAPGAKGSPSNPSQPGTTNEDDPEPDDEPGSELETEEEFQ